MTTYLAQTATATSHAGSDPERKALIHEVAQEITLQGGRVRFRVAPPIQAAISGGLP
jgi:hypothetical protein